MTNPGGWLLVVSILAAATLTGVILARRSGRRSDWTAEMAAVANSTYAAVALRKPPSRTELLDLAARWSALAAGATDQPGRRQAAELAALLRELADADAKQAGELAGRVTAALAGPDRYPYPA